jgi:hypothetical protein
VLRVFSSSPLRLGFWAFLAILTFGCAERKNQSARYIPESEVARQAVAATLTAWKNGQTTQQVATSTPSARLIDNQHKPEQRLKHFEIIGEVAADYGRGFAVRLTLENPEERQIARYLVYGIDPLWVFRQEDLDFLTHWEHPMDEAEPEKTAVPDEAAGTSKARSQPNQPAPPTPDPPEDAGPSLHPQPSGT